MIVSPQGTPGGWSSPQVKASSTTRAFGHAARRCRAGRTTGPRAPLPTPVAEVGVAPAQLALQRLGVGVEQQLVRIEAVAGGGLVGAVDAIAVEQAGIAPPADSRARPRRCIPAARCARSRAGPRGRTGTARPWSACAENRAKLTPLPSQVAPSGCGRPGHTVIRAAAISAAAQCGWCSRITVPKRGQGEGQRVRPAVRADVLGHRRRRHCRCCRRRRPPRRC